MSRNHRSRLLVGLAVAPLILAAAPAALADAAPSRTDPLAVGKLDQSQISLDFRDKDVVSAFRLFAQFGEVPFVLAFENDPTLRLTFKAERMSLRTILNSVADTYGLEYEASDAGVVVRRRGMPASPRPITVGAWPPKPGPLYKLEIQTRDPKGGVPVLVTPIVVPAQSLGTFKLGLATGRDVTTFDRERLIAEPRFVGSIQLNLCIKKETSAGLELLLEIVAERPLGDGRYVEEHTVTMKTTGPGETLLFKTEDGRQIVLKSWSRVAAKSSSIGEDAEAGVAASS